VSTWRGGNRWKRERDSDRVRRSWEVGRKRYNTKLHLVFSNNIKNKKKDKKGKRREKKMINDK